ncbi:hypothetical protein GCM10009721_28170 [Terrabacter tumescens]|uniref:Helix-turn-helix domain-containing protein n=1 Tax=Terrabacter tumescens TaxID=60443 RepID=A0ABQ2I6I3_9MICO|nr:hypothetical protein GCM10009721_28170 [Terrabacter tumescens]
MPETWPMPYPSRPVPEPLPQFLGTATNRQTPEQRKRLLEYVGKGYLEGKSLRVLAAETDRTQTAIRRALRDLDMPLRDRGAPPINT